MTDEREDRDSGFDDLFEDLDKFFAPEEKPEGRRRRGEGGRESPAAGGTGPDRTGDATDAGSPAPSEDEILSGDWFDVEGLDLGEPAEAPAPPSAAPSEPPAPAAPAEEPPVVGATMRSPEETAPSGERQEATAGAGADRSGGPTAEMSQQDWNRVRRALGDEGGTTEADEVAATERRGPSDLDLFPSEEEFTAAEEQARHELTLDDLKKAPAEYEHLPRPDEEGFADDRDAIREGRGAFLGEREGVRDDFADVGERPLVPESTSGEPWQEPAATDTSEEPTARSGQQGAPGIAEVEAAADQMAEEFRTGLPPDDELLADLRYQEQRRTVRVGEPESLMGPTWEEPGSEVVAAEPSAPMFAGRNMPMALLTAVVLAVLALISIAIDKAFFAFIAGGVVLVGQAEVYAAMHRKGYQPATALGLVVGGLVLAAAYLKGEQAMLSLVVLGTVLSFLWYMAAGPKARDGALVNIGATMLGLAYVPLMAGFLLVILAQPVSGRALTLALLGMTFLYDAAAFVIGSLWGSRALAPTISPKKSWEGLLAATFVTFIVSIAVLPSIDPLTLGRSVGLALIIAVFAPLGDLAESLMKRDLGVKDMGSMLPGHGGIMDRIDSALFVIPAAFYYLRLIF
jgi:CDP-diglyceride synthetase